MHYVAAILIQLSLAFAEDVALCEVTLRVVDTEGRPVAYRVAAFRNRSSQDFTDQFAGLKGRVPCSVSPYTFLVARIDVSNVYANIVGEAYASQPENWKTVVTNPNLRLFGDTAGIVHRLLPAGYVWKGRVSGGHGAGERLWVNLRSAVGTSNEEAEVDTKGEFRFYRAFAEGPHILTLMNERGVVVHSITLEITTFAPVDDLEIDLSKGSPSSIVVR